MSLVDDIKNAVKKSGSNKGKIIYFKPGVKMRIRLLNDMDEGMKVLFHDSFAEGINIPCQELFDRECTHHEDEELRHRDMYCWSAWDYEAKEVKILLAAVNNCSPVPALVGMYDTYGTVIDRDYVITKNGSQTSTTFSVVPMDKVKFKNSKAKPFSESKILSILDKAFPSDEDNESDDDDDKPAKKSSKSKKDTKKKSSKKAEPEEDDDDNDLDYDDMTVKELYKLCVERDIKVKPKKDEDFYIKKLKEYDEENSEDEESEDEDDENEESYEEMSALELYKLCKKRGIKVAPKKSEKFYVKKLEEFEENNTEDEDEDEEDW